MSKPTFEKDYETALEILAECESTSSDKSTEKPNPTLKALGLLQVIFLAGVFILAQLKKHQVVAELPGWVAACLVACFAATTIAFLRQPGTILGNTPRDLSIGSLAVLSLLVSVPLALTDHGVLSLACIVLALVLGQVAVVTGALGMLRDVWQILRSPSRMLFRSQLERNQRYKTAVAELASLNTRSLEHVITETEERVRHRGQLMGVAALGLPILAVALRQTDSSFMSRIMFVAGWALGGVLLGQFLIVVGSGQLEFVRRALAIARSRNPDDGIST